MGIQQMADECVTSEGAITCESTMDGYMSAMCTTSLEACAACNDDCEKGEDLTLDFASSYSQTPTFQSKKLDLGYIDDEGINVMMYLSSDACDLCGENYGDIDFYVSPFEGDNINLVNDGEGELTLTMSGAGRICLVPSTGCEYLQLIEMADCGAELAVTFYFDDFYNYTTDDTKLNSNALYQSIMAFARISSTIYSAVTIAPTNEDIEVQLPNFWDRQVNGRRLEDTPQRRLGDAESEECVPSWVVGEDNGCLCLVPGRTGGPECGYYGSVYLGNLQGMNDEVLAAMSDLPIARKVFQFRNNQARRGPYYFPTPQDASIVEIVQDYKPREEDAVNVLLYFIIIVGVVGGIMALVILYATYSDACCHSDEDEKEQDPLVEGAAAGTPDDLQMTDRNMEETDCSPGDRPSVVQVNDTQSYQQG